MKREFPIRDSRAFASPTFIALILISRASRVIIYCCDTLRRDCINAKVIPESDCGGGMLSRGGELASPVPTMQPPAEPLIPFSCFTHVNNENLLITYVKFSKGRFWISVRTSKSLSPRSPAANAGASSGTIRRTLRSYINMVRTRGKNPAVAINAARK